MKLPQTAYAPEIRAAVGVVFLLFQIVAVAHARFVPSRWLAWAPNDYASWYRLQVQSKGRSLSSDEVRARYHLPTEGVYENPIQNIMDIVRQRERTYGQTDGVRVDLVYRPNGGVTQEWLWPEN